MGEAPTVLILGKLYKDGQEQCPDAGSGGPYPLFS